MRNILLGKQANIGTPRELLDSVNSRHEFSSTTENYVTRGENFLKLKIHTAKKDEVSLV